MKAGASYEQFFVALAKQKVRYLVVGGFAVNFHQVQRATMDLDLIVHLEKDNLEGFLNVVSMLGFKPKAPVNPMDLVNSEIREEWLQRRGCGFSAFINPRTLSRWLIYLLRNPNHLIFYTLEEWICVHLV